MRKKRPPGLRRGDGTGMRSSPLRYRAVSEVAAFGELAARAGEQQIPALLARAGAQIDHVIGGGDRVRIVLDDQNRVAEVAQALQDVDQAMRVARMEPDGRFVEHVQRADQMRAQRRRQLNALRLAARKRGSQAVQRQILQADFIEEEQALANLLQNFVGDGRLLRRSIRDVHKMPGLRHGHGADFRDGFAGDANRARLRPKPRAVAFRADGVAAIAAQENAHVEFVFLPFEPREKPVHPVVSGFRFALDDQVLLRGGEIAEWNIERNIVRASKFLHLDQQRAIARLGPRLNRRLRSGIWRDRESPN